MTQPPAIMTDLFEAFETCRVSQVNGSIEVEHEQAAAISAWLREKMAPQPPAAPSSSAVNLAILGLSSLAMVCLLLIAIAALRGHAAAPACQGSLRVHQQAGPGQSQWS